MLNCKYTIEFDNFTKSFNSEQELNDYLVKNATKLQASLDIGKVKFSKETNEDVSVTDPEKSVQEITFDKLKELKRASIERTKVNSMGAKVEDNVNTGFIGVTRYMDTLTVDGTLQGRPLFTKFDLQDFKRMRTIQLTKEYE